jgi:hypothetical protein
MPISCGVHEREDHRVILNETCGNSERRSTVVDTTMDGLAWLRKHVEQADTDLLRDMVKLFCERLM